MNIGRVFFKIHSLSLGSHQAIGVVKPILYIMLIANGVNALAGYIFISKYKLGVDGAAIVLVGVNAS